MPVTVDVAREGKQKFFVAVAVTMAFDDPEALSDEIERTAPKGHRPMSLWGGSFNFIRQRFGVIKCHCDRNRNKKFLFAFACHINRNRHCHHNITRTSRANILANILARLVRVMLW